MLKHSGAMLATCLDTKDDLQAPMHPVFTTTCANGIENSSWLHFACTAAGEA